MVRVNLETLVMGNAPGASVLILRPAEDDPNCVLPICIGPFEAAAIGKGVSGEKSSRPMTHALINNIVTQLGGRISRVVVDKVRGTVFYATICVERGIETIKIDARPSDAIAIAVRTKVPVLPVYLPGDKKLWSRPHVVIGEPYYPEQTRDYDKVAEDMMQRIFALREEIK